MKNIITITTATIITLLIMAGSAMAADPEMARLFPIVKAGYVDDAKMLLFFPAGPAPQQMFFDSKGFEEASIVKFGSAQTSFKFVSGGVGVQRNFSYAQFYQAWYQMRDKMTAMDMRKLLILDADNAIQAWGWQFEDEMESLVKRGFLSIFVICKNLAVGMDGVEPYWFIQQIMAPEFASAGPHLREVAGSLMAGDPDRALEAIRKGIDDSTAEVIPYLMSKM